MICFSPFWGSSQRGGAPFEIDVTNLLKVERSQRNIAGILQIQLPLYDHTNQAISQSVSSSLHRSSNVVSIPRTTIDHKLSRICYDIIQIIMKHQHQISDLTCWTSWLQNHRSSIWLRSFMHSTVWYPFDGKNPRTLRPWNVKHWKHRASNSCQRLFRLLPIQTRKRQLLGSP